MEKRKLRIIFHKAGNGVGAKVNMPIPWLRDLGINENEREVELVLDKDNKEIIIRKEKQ